MKHHINLIIFLTFIALLIAVILPLENTQIITSSVINLQDTFTQTISNNKTIYTIFGIVIIAAILLGIEKHYKKKLRRE